MSRSSPYPETYRLVTIVAAFLKLGAVFKLLLEWEIEDLLADRKLTIHIFLGETEIDDIKESYLRQG